MICPQDESRLFPYSYEGAATVDICRRCRGVWLDKGELEAIEETVERDYAEELAAIPDMVGSAFHAAFEKESAALTCPRCRVEMERKEYAYCSQVLIDACPRCGGVWLDKGELEALEIFYERSRKKAGPARRMFLKGLLQ